MLRYIVTFCVLLTIGLTGCGKKAETEEPVPPITVLYDGVRAQLETNNVDAALGMLDEAMTDEQFAENKAGIFNAIVSIQLSNDRVEEAISRYQAMVTNSTEVAEHSFATMARSLDNPARLETLLSLTTSLLDAPFQERTKAHLFITHAKALTDKGQPEEALAMIGKCRDELSVAVRVQAFSRIISMLIGSDKADTATKAIDMIAAKAGNVPEILELVTLSRLRVHAAGSNWESFTTLFAKEVSSLTDQGATSALNSGLGALNLNTQAATADKLCSIVIDSRSAADRSVLRAARALMKRTDGVSSDKIVSRTTLLVDKGIPADKLVGLLRTPFYAVLQREDAEQLKAMIGMVDKLSEKLSAERDLVSANGMMLDGRFILNDYDNAIAMVENGVAGRDENWHKSALVKLKAHRALDAGNIEEAVKYFREFMNVIEDTMDRETDPSTGLTYTANWCLGRNAKRIGDMLKDAGETKRAGEAYAEAKGYFEKALGEFKESSDERAAIEEEMAEVPRSK